MADGFAELLAVPEPRAAALRPLLERLREARRVVLTTHVNADGDGTGSQAAVAAWLEQQGARAAIVNPTPFPDNFRFLLHRPDLAVDWKDGDPAVEALLADADLFLVLDTSEAVRLEGLAARLPAERTLVIDHHPPGPTVLGTAALQDTDAAAAGELVYDLLTLAGDGWPDAAVRGIYVAVVSDTGSFRYSNTSPRVHALAADLVRRGVDPEEMYRHLFATFSLRRIELLRDALGTLRTDEHAPITWIVLSEELTRRTEATAEDIDGIIEFARAIEGTEVALIFRELPGGRTKISFRSAGAADVNRVARQFGGGGHVRASGAVADGAPEAVIPRVLEAVRGALMYVE